MAQKRIRSPVLCGEHSGCRSLSKKSFEQISDSPNTISIQQTQNEMNKNIDEIIDFCYRANYGSFDEFLRCDKYMSAFSKNLKDIYFNHLIPIAGTDCRDLLMSHKDDFASKNRTPCVYTTPLSFNYENPIDGLECAAMESFLYYKRDNFSVAGDLVAGALRAPDLPCSSTPGYQVKLIGADRADEFVKIFNAAFSTGVYAGIGPEYGDVERKFFPGVGNTGLPTGFESLVFLIEKSGRPPAQGSGATSAVGGMRAVIKNDMAFLFSMAVLPDERAGGFAARHLGASVLQELFARGAVNIFCQTEYDSRLEHFYHRHGFERLFLGRYWVCA